MTRVQEDKVEVTTDDIADCGVSQRTGNQELPTLSPSINADLKARLPEIHT